MVRTCAYTDDIYTHNNFILIIIAFIDFVNYLLKYIMSVYNMKSRHFVHTNNI